MNAEELRRRITALLVERRDDPVPLAQQLGRGRDYLADFLTGRKQSLKADFLAALAIHFQVPISHLTIDDSAEARAVFRGENRPIDAQGDRDWREGPPAPPGRLRPVGRQIPVVGEVAAGLWREALPADPSDFTTFVDVDVKGYERAQLYALKVVGPSMDMFYTPGRFVIVAPAAEAGVRIGDHVVVQRMKADLVELTIKELVQENGRIALYPRSHDPLFQTPIYLSGDESDQAAPRIIGVVVADYGRRERPQQGYVEAPKTWAE